MTGIIGKGILCNTETTTKNLAYVSVLLGENHNYTLQVVQKNLVRKQETNLELIVHLNGETGQKSTFQTGFDQEIFSVYATFLAGTRKEVIIKSFK